MTTNYTGLLICVIVASVVHAQHLTAKKYDSCYTPAGEPGQCIAIRNCLELVRVLQRRPLTSESAAYLRSAHCGFEGLEAKVCCSLNNHDLSPTVRDKKTTTEVPISSILPDKYDCGQSSADKIVGGEVADLFDFPWMALIEYKRPDGYGFYCGGSLISKRYVLTAAHCLKGNDLPSGFEVVSVRLGEYNLETDVDCVTTPEYKTCSEQPIDVPVVEKIAHEYYNPFDVNQYNDIALLRLDRDVPYTEFIKPICLPVYPNLLKQSFAGTNATVAGWGKTSETGSDSSVKMKVNLPVKSNRDCEDVYGGTRVSLSKLQVCAGGVNGKDSCRGDSGGPLMNLYTAPGEINWYVTGIVSFGPAKCGLNGWPGIYTRVTEYIPWILKNMRP